MREDSQWVWKAVSWQGVDYLVSGLAKGQQSRILLYCRMVNEGVSRLAQVKQVTCNEVKKEQRNSGWWLSKRKITVGDALRPKMA